MSISRARATPGNRGEVPGQRPFWRLIVSRQFSVLFTVKWTRCGRGPEPVRVDTA